TGLAGAPASSVIRPRPGRQQPRPRAWTYTEAGLRLAVVFFYPEGVRYRSPGSRSAPREKGCRVTEGAPFFYPEGCMKCTTLAGASPLPVPRLRGAHLSSGRSLTVPRLRRETR